MTTPARRTRVRPGTTATTGRRPGASRPAPAPRTREATPEDDRRGPAWLRWVILGAIGVVLLVTLVPTARSLARQRAEIDALQTKVAQQQTQVASLQAEQERWTDPAYVEQQARDRLKFVKVGDRSYTVIDPQEAARPTVSGASVAAPKANSDAPWYGQIWQSVQLADRPTAGMLPVTAPSTAPSAAPTTSP
jgi:cell division protein FtsL